MCVCGCGSFGTSPGEEVKMAVDPDPDKRREGVLHLSEHEWARSEKYVKFYAMLLRDSDPSVRCAAVQALGRADNPEYLPQIVGALSDSTESVRLAAARVLNRMSGDIAVEPLRNRALMDPSADVRMWSARALGCYRDKEVISTLVRCLSDSSFGVCYKAHESLVELTGRDCGYEPENWSAVAMSDPIEKQSFRSRKPWWDWMGITRKKSTTPDEPGKSVDTESEKGS